ncbi:hypothetical protein [Ciceribacter sp. L1K22]|uniref:hypothetical protein n=1 Tax=Ciceribacter sp. L1K22 TaxID=2820275 RepID=UPI001ABEDFAA|nr:hypothetical protein [Ciceribacter sp. L1K22]MBO3760395.1 hypothetical protein [Ciceribacter sp. L1K22]
MTKFTRETALKAHRIAKRKHLRGKELGLELGVSTDDANRLFALGYKWQLIAEARLTEPEKLLIRCLAAEHLELLSAGASRSPESKLVSWRARKSEGWAAATANKRLFDERWDEKSGLYVKGLHFVHVAGNGYIWLLDAGWACADAMGLIE